MFFPLCDNFRLLVAMVTSADVNKVVRRVVFPTLRSLGFTKLRGRNAWRYLDDSIWVFNLRSVGKYFSDVTGFPPQSLTAWMGIYYLDFPDPANPALRVDPKRDKDGLLIPKESKCHTTYPLQVLTDQTEIRRVIVHDLERQRDDVWYVANDGTNVEDVVADINRSILEFGVPLLEKPYNTRAVQLERRRSALDIEE
jgi:hypothetical protein